jgi:two-component system chemotaxis response regulator CheY
MKTVLIVDDSRITRRHLSRLVAGSGYETREAEDGLAGLAAIGEHAPDCVLLDILMPNMDGIRFLKEAGERGVGVPIIVMSADAQTPEREKQLLDLGARAVVDKPPRGQDDLLAAVRDALAEG